MIVTLVVLAEVTLPGNQTAFMPGQISSAHAWERDASGRSVARDCRACHDPWRGVVDQRCLQCHVQKPHSAIQAETPSCSSCHPEHRAATTLVGATCVSCHGNLREHVKPGVVLRPAIAHINAFGDTHPEFTWPPDTDTLAFNHKLHLRPAGILDGEGKREVLQCTGCHKLVETRGKLDPRPLKFATDCARCHKLTFDLRFPDAEVPHGGDPGLVYGFVLAIDSGNQDIAGKSPDEIRRILTNRPPPNLGEGAWLNAEQVINKKCTLCHDLQRSGGRLVVTPPVIRTRWLEHGQFTHTPHGGLECVSCHRSAPSSALTRDVLMPSRKECAPAVTADPATKKQPALPVTSTMSGPENCSRSRRAGLTRRNGRASAGGNRRDGLGTILLLAIVVLLMVVLIPVSLALYQRLRVPTDESGGARRPSPPPSPVIPPPQKTSPPAALPMVQPPPPSRPQPLRPHNSPPRRRASPSLQWPMRR